MDDICKYVDFEDNKRILDIGCGVISVLNLIPGERYGIDPLMKEYKNMFKLDKNITWSKGYGEKILFDNDFFDIVFCTNVLGHTENRSKVLSEIKRVLKNKGKLVLTVDVFDEKEGRDPAHPHSFLEADVNNLLPNNFRILFNKKSSIGAQVYAFVKGKVRQGGHKEQILIAEKDNPNAAKNLN
jgi:ubiquinone/menaquinone biosynthesis C-methylase UbiE